MKILASSAVLALVLLFAGKAQAQAKPKSLPVGHCINLGNHLENGDASGKRLDAGDMANIRAAGFDTVRIPVQWTAHSTATSPYSIEPSWLARVGEVVDAALVAKLNVILDSHNFEGLNKDPEANALRLAKLWHQIADYFADRPRARLWFEVANEPHDRLTNANLLRVLGSSLIAIRLSNPDRPVILGGERWSGVDSLASLPLPADPNVYPTFHYYTPMDFTHQGAIWVSPTPPVGRVWGKPGDRERLAADVAKVQAFIARTGKVPLLGETGAFSLISLDQRVAYYQAVYNAFAPLGVGVCPWAYTNTFRFYDHKGKRWLPGMLGALGLREQGKKSERTLGATSPQTP